MLGVTTIETRYPRAGAKTALTYSHMHILQTYGFRRISYHHGLSKSSLSELEQEGNIRNGKNDNFLVFTHYNFNLLTLTFSQSKPKNTTERILLNP